MTELSIRAKNYLASQERSSSTVIREEIIDSLIANDAPIFESIIEFQQNYSGYQFMAGLEPIYFGILQGDGGYPVRTGTAIVEFNSSDAENSEYQFVCATSEFPMDFTLDEYGRYYEDNEIVASSFEKIIEHLAIWSEIETREDFKVMLRDQQLDIRELDKKLGLTMIREASDAHRLWFQNEFIYLTQRYGMTTIVTSEDFYKIEALMNM
ncbi:MAG: hypothetical protein V4722_02070 [Bacteroidota bacterium]